MSTTASTVVLEGDLRPDGTIALDRFPPLPPGRVRVTVQVIEPPPPVAILPDLPWLDDCISVPFDLPHFSEAHVVRQHPAAEPRLPEPFETEPE